MADAVWTAEGLAQKGGAAGLNGGTQAADSEPQPSSARREGPDAAANEGPAPAPKTDGECVLNHHQQQQGQWIEQQQHVQHSEQEQHPQQQQAMGSSPPAAEAAADDGILGANAPASADAPPSGGSNTLFFAKVPPSASADEIAALFSCHGSVQDVNLFRAWAGAHSSKGCGLVVYKSADEANAALAALHGIHRWEGSDSAMVVEWLDESKQREKKSHKEGKESKSGSSGTSSGTRNPSSAAASGPEVVPLGCAQDAYKLFVGNVPKGLGEETLMPLFAALGEVVELVVVRDKENMASKGSAFVWYAHREQADAAVAYFERHNTRMQDGMGMAMRPLVVRRAKPSRHVAPASKQLPSLGLLNGMAGLQGGGASDGAAAGRGFGLGGGHFGAGGVRPMGVASAMHGVHAMSPMAGGAGHHHQQHQQQQQLLQPSELLMDGSSGSATARLLQQASSSSSTDMAPMHMMPASLHRQWAAAQQAGQGAAYLPYSSAMMHQPYASIPGMQLSMAQAGGMPLQHAHEAYTSHAGQMLRQMGGMHHEQGGSSFQTTGSGGSLLNGMSSLDMGPAQPQFRHHLAAADSLGSITTASSNSGSSSGMATLPAGLLAGQGMSIAMPSGGGGGGGSVALGAQQQVPIWAQTGAPYHPSDYAPGGSAPAGGAAAEQLQRLELQLHPAALHTVARHTHTVGALSGARLELCIGPDGCPVLAMEGGQQQLAAAQALLAAALNE